MSEPVIRCYAYKFAFGFGWRHVANPPAPHARTDRQYTQGLVVCPECRRTIKATIPTAALGVEK